MSIRQLSVFVENKAGHLAGVLDVLAGSGANVLAFAVADCSDYGILRLIVDDIDRALKALGDGSFTVSEHPIVCARIPQERGALDKLVRRVAESGADLEYIYMGAQDSIIMKTDSIDELEALLETNGFSVISLEDFV